MPPTASSPTTEARRFRRVLCVYPYRRELATAGFFPPLGLECIAAVIEPHARRIDIVDLRKEAGRTRDFLRAETDLVCFSVNWDRDPEFIREEIRSVPPGIFTLVGGRHATEVPEYWLSAFPNVDALVRGDGEEAVEEFCRAMPLERIAGLSFREGGRICHNPNRTLTRVSDEVYPNRRLRRYTYDMRVENISTGLAVDSMAASRGCPYNCTFCSFNRNPWGQKRKWSARSPESVVAELAEIDAPIVGFSDDLFTFDMNRVERICDLLLARGIRKKYFINARLEIARRPDVLRKMERAGFALLLLGIESAHDKTLRSMGKGFHTAQAREYFKVLRRTSMILHGYFILGNIGESVEEMRQIVPFAHELGVDTLGLTMLRASPYSGLGELVAQSPGYHIAASGKVYSDHCSIRELRGLRRRLYRDFYDVRQVCRVLRKGVGNTTLEILTRLILNVPGFSWRLGMHLRRRAKRRHEHRREAATPVPSVD